MRVTSNFAKKVLEYRTKNNLSQWDVASKANSSQSMISKIETALDEGRRIIISNKTYKSVANLLKRHDLQGDPTPLGVEKRGEKKEFQFTIKIARLFNKKRVLEENLHKVLNQAFWQRKISIQEKIEYLTHISNIDADIPYAILEAYPELAGKSVSWDSETEKITVN